MKKIVLISLLTFTAAAQIAAVILYSNGIAGYNNSPGEVTCANCHITYPVNDSGGNMIISLPSCSNNYYVAGQTYTINITIRKNGLYLFGFSFEALDSSGANAGSLALITPSTTLLLNTSVSGNNRTNVTHYGGMYGTDSCTFSFKWTAPSANVGKISLYAAANASNGDGYVDGDYIYTATRTLNPDLGLAAYAENSPDQLTVFPNPTRDLLFIDANTTGKLNVELSDVNGLQVFASKIPDKSKINVGVFKEGVYTLTVKTVDRVMNKKLVIVR